MQHKQTIAQYQKMKGIVPPKTSGETVNREIWDYRDELILKVILSNHSPDSIRNKIRRIMKDSDSLLYYTNEELRVKKIKINTKICQN